MSANTNVKTKKPQKQAKEAVANVVSSGVANNQLRSAIQRRRTIVGVVVSDKMTKTIVVKVDRRVRDPLYKKYVTRSRKFKAHDEKNEAKVGDLVSLVETRPLSREKRWALQSIVRRGGFAPEVNV